MPGPRLLRFLDDGGDAIRGLLRSDPMLDAVRTHPMMAREVPEATAERMLRNDPSVEAELDDLPMMLRINPSQQRQSFLLNRDIDLDRLRSLDPMFPPEPPKAPSWASEWAIPAAGGAIAAGGALAATAPPRSQSRAAAAPTQVAPVDYLIKAGMDPRRAKYLIDNPQYMNDSVLRMLPPQARAVFQNR